MERREEKEGQKDISNIDNRSSSRSIRSRSIRSSSIRSSRYSDSHKSKKKKKEKNVKKKKKKKRKYKSSSSSSSDSSDNNSDNNSDRSGDRSGDNKSDDKSDDSDTNISDEKKRKRKKKEKKKKKKSSNNVSSTCVNQSDYGKYGIIRETDFHAKSISFQVWLRDVKKIQEFNGPRWEAMEYFKEYMEDFNTATFPSERYYDVERYDKIQYEKALRKKAKKDSNNDCYSSRGGGGGSSSGTAAENGVIPTLLLDMEGTLRQEQRMAREKQIQDEFQKTLSQMDRSKVEAMRKQDELRIRMQSLYRAGQIDEARKIEQLLNKQDDVKK